MVINQSVNYNSFETLSAIFGALADPCRLKILDRLSRGEATVKELASPFKISLPAISRHLKVLERAGLISRGQDAQWRPCRIEPATVKAVSTWAEYQTRQWNDRLDSLESYLQTSSF